VFIIECTVKIVGQGFKPWRYFYNHQGLDGWNSFDSVVVAGSLAPVGENGGLITMLRLLRLLRVLKLVKSLPELQVIVTALVNGLASIGYIATILMMFFYIFGILGMLLFKDNDPWHFGTLHISMITLFRCSTLEDWTDVMYVNHWGCQYYGYGGGLEHLCWCKDCGMGWISFFYFFVFTVIGALVLMTLFIGVVTTSMEEAQSKQEEDKKREDEAQKVKDEENIPGKTMAMYRVVFDQLDVDCGGTVEEDELRLGLMAINQTLTHLELRRLVHYATQKVDEEEAAGPDDKLEPQTFAEFCRLIINLRTARLAILGKPKPKPKPGMQESKSAPAPAAAKVSNVSEQKQGGTDTSGAETDVGTVI